MSVYMNTHNIPLDIPLTTSQLQMRAAHHHCPPGLKHTRIHMHTSIQSQVCRMLNVKARVQNKPTQVTNSETAYLIPASWTEKHTQAHTSEAIQFAECIIKQEQRQKRGDGNRPPHHLFLCFAARASFVCILNSTYPGLSLPSSLPHPLQSDTFYSWDGRLSGRK